MEDTDRNEWMAERMQLACGRLDELAQQQPRSSYDEYFRDTASFAGLIWQVSEMAGDGRLAAMTQEALRDLNGRLYEDILPGRYEESWTNPSYAAAKFGTDMGRRLAWLADRIRAMIPLAFQDRRSEMLAVTELFLQTAAMFENGIPEIHTVDDAIYWCISDYADSSVGRRVREQFDPSLSFYTDLIRGADLNDTRYLYLYGEYISDDALGTARYLASVSQEKIDAMAAVFVRGYLEGFRVSGIDRTGKKTVNIRFSIGFERIVRSAMRQFADAGLTTVIYRVPVFSVSRIGRSSGLQGTSPNPQYDYDHRNDYGLFLDKALCERILEAERTAFAQYAGAAEVFAGPALIDVFGEAPFDPVSKAEAVSLTPEQQKLFVYLLCARSRIVTQYIDQASISFTIIAWPLPSIGPDYQKIMQETFRINNLDNDRWRAIQQKIIDAADGARYMHVKGAGANRTDIRVQLHPLDNPSAQTDFENCCADVNIPVGEVFTSPVLAGTNGTLHVSGVYLDGLYYRNLVLTFRDGCVVSYDCSNYPDRAQNRQYIEENLLRHHRTLPMGEFAIGTNTPAYMMQRRYGIEARMPILIKEKTGPHFAVGDTCYSHAEEHKVYNPDGKEIIARENEISARRHENPEQAYFNVHTDITVPYDEIGCIAAVFDDGKAVEIIRGGRFCLPGTEELNKAFDCDSALNE